MTNEDFIRESQENGKSKGLTKREEMATEIFAGCLSGAIGQAIAQAIGTSAQDTARHTVARLSVGFADTLLFELQRMRVEDNAQ